VFVVENKTLPFHTGSISVINNSEYHVAINKKGIKSEWFFLEMNPEKLLFNFHGFDFSHIDIEHWCGSKFNNIIDSTKNPAISELVLAIASELKMKNTDDKQIIKYL